MSFFFCTIHTKKHFKTKLHVIGLSIQPHKCVTWSPYGLLLDFNTPSQFTTPLEGIIILGVPLDTSSFTSSFIKDALLNNVWHVDIFLKMGDVQVALVSTIQIKIICTSMLLLLFREGFEYCFILHGVVIWWGCWRLGWHYEWEIPLCYRWCKFFLCYQCGFTVPFLLMFNVVTLTLGLATKVKGLQGCEPRGSPRVKAKALQGCGPKGSRGVTSHTPVSVRKCEGVWGSEHSHSQNNSHFGRCNHGGLSKLQRAIAGVKPQCLVTFFISLKSF